MLLVIQEMNFITRCSRKAKKVQVVTHCPGKEEVQVETHCPLQPSGWKHTAGKDTAGKRKLIKEEVAKEECMTICKYFRAKCMMGHSEVTAPSDCQKEMLHSGHR